MKSFNGSHHSLQKERFSNTQYGQDHAGIQWKNYAINFFKGENSNPGAAGHPRCPKNDPCYSTGKVFIILRKKLDSVPDDSIFLFKSV